VPIDIPTASMSDVAFLLLVFFMLAATFASTAGLDLGLPDQEAEDEIEPIESVFVEIGAGGGITVDGRPLALGELVGHLEPILGAAPDKPVIVHAVSSAPYGAMVDVLDELRTGEERRALGPVRLAVPTEREIALYWPDRR
jgi:biopolymer transport protein ExbD